jgi:hypothetical protein
MKMRNNIIVAACLMLSGCDTVYHHNTVYQVDTEEHPSAAARYTPIDTGITTGFKANNCTTDHYGDMKPYNVRPRHCETYDNGYCCAWVTEFSSEHVCMEEWCYWEDTCEWDLNGWGEECYLKPNDKEKQGE